MENDYTQSNKGKRKLHIVTISLFVIAFVLYFAGFRIYDNLRGIPKITIENNSNAVLEEITLSGTGFENTIDAIAPHKSKTVRVKPTSESDLKIAFMANDTSYSKSGLSYIEPFGGYKVRVSINHEFEIKTISR